MLSVLSALSLKAAIFYSTTTTFSPHKQFGNIYYVEKFFDDFKQKHLQIFQFLCVNKEFFIDKIQFCLNNLISDFACSIKMSFVINFEISIGSLNDIDKFDKARGTGNSCVRIFSFLFVRNRQQVFLSE